MDYGVNIMYLHIRVRFLVLVVLFVYIIILFSIQIPLISVNYAFLLERSMMESLEDCAQLSSIIEIRDTKAIIEDVYHIYFNEVWFKQCLWERNWIISKV